jgi:putative transposase
MARPPRPQIAGATYHVTIRGARRLPIFFCDDDRHDWLRIIEDVVERHRWELLGYTLMGNHWHLVVRTPEANISAGMQRLNHLFACGFNRRHGLSGHVFDRRFFSRLIRSEIQLVTVMRYLALNPVLAGLCRRAERYRWSSFPALFGLAGTPRFLSHGWIGALGDRIGQALEAFADLLRDDPVGPRAGPAGAPARAGRRPVRGSPS